MFLFTFFSSVVAFSFIMIMLSPLFISLDIVETYSKIILNVALSFGAIFGGLGGLKYLQDYFDQNMIRKRINHYKNLYPASKLGKTFDVVDKQGEEGGLFIRDYNSNRLYHIYNPETYRDLELETDRSKVITLPKEEFEKYDKGERIVTRK